MYIQLEARSTKLHRRAETLFRFSCTVAYRGEKTRVSNMPKTKARQRHKQYYTYAKLNLPYSMGASYKGCFPSGANFPVETLTAERASTYILYISINTFRIHPWNVHTTEQTNSPQKRIRKTFTFRPSCSENHRTQRPHARSIPHSLDNLPGSVSLCTVAHRYVHTSN